MKTLSNAKPKRRLSFQPLEQRLVFSIPPHSNGNDSYEVYAWALINTMRENPAAFGANLVRMYNHQGSAYGLSSSDPVWDDIRSVIKQFDGQRESDGGVWRFGEWISFIESQNYKLGPLALEESLSQGAYDHTTWMTSHASYGHSIGLDDAASSYVRLNTMQGFGTPNESNPDRVRLSSEFDGSWSEDIGYHHNGINSTYAAWKNHKISDAGFYQRAVFFDMMGYIIDWGNGAHTDAKGNFHPAYGHLQSLLSSDRTEDQSLNLAGSGAQNKTRGYRDAIGIDFDFFQTGDGNPNDGLANAWVSTLRLAEHNHRDGGGYLVAFAWSDLNGDGFYTPGIGEGPQLTYGYGYSEGGLGIGGSIAMTGTNYGAATIGYFPDTVVSVSLSVNRRDLGPQRVTVHGGNVLVKTPAISSGFNLTRGDQVTLAADSNEPNDSWSGATYVGSFNAQTPSTDYAGLFSLYPKGDQDWYAFDTTSPGGALFIDVGYKESTGAVNAKLYRQNSQGGLDLVETLGAAGDDQIFRREVTPGRYYLDVYAAGAAANFYSLTLGVGFPPVDPLITSAATATFLAGTSDTYTIATTGAPIGAITAPEGLPSGVSIADNHDGTAVLTVSPAMKAGVYWFPIEVDNGAASRQAFTLNISPSTPHQRYVHAVYNDVLSRAPDPGGLTYWTNLLDQGLPVSSVAAAIAHSDEYYANFVIKPAYLALLDRPAEQEGLKFWTKQMHQGMTQQQLQSLFIAGDEFYARAGGDDAKWIDSVYQHLLGRTAEAEGAQFWLNQLGQGQTRPQVASQIAGSAENNAQIISADYFQYLGRAPEPAGLDFWLHQFEEGKTNEDLIAGFTGSDEYYQRQTA